MKAFKNIAAIGVLSFLTATIAVSCTDGNDWDVDPSTDRLFQPSVDATVSATTAELKWSKIAGAEYYVIELSKDTLYDAITETPSSIVLGTDKSITASPYTVTNLDSSTKYFLRVKSVSSTKESKWHYPSFYSFTTKAEQILNPVSNIGGQSATINWEKDKTVTHLVITETATGASSQVELDATAQQNGSIKITGLTPKTEYSVEIYNGTVLRGTLKFATTEAYPEGYDIVTVTDAAMLNDIFTNPASYITENNGNLVLVFPKESPEIGLMGEGDILTIPAEIASIVFWGEAGDEKPVFKPKGLAFEGNHETVRFYNLDLKNNGSGSDYVINQNKVGNIEELSIDNCLVSDTRGVLRVQGDGAQGAISNFTINNSILTNIGSYAIVNTKVAGSTIGNITLSKSTFNGIAAGGVIITQSDNVQINIEECTFYNCVQSGKSFIDINKMNGVTVTVNKTIIGQMYGYKDDGSTNIKATSVKNIWSAMNLFTTSDCPYSSGNEWGEILDKTSAEVFVDPTNGDFHLLQTLNAGDPRWIE